ncbi:hypothetical protein FHS43_006182 [Streptosporangium becharense]|uniref:Uncharacterized protein n=1 Tax=Streptosporangium becharense TaxID=1816182 RepID=A0A7W9MHC9_9ACTN|nr:hypothetical protein [Streptosporangium becharense]MBB2914870.1 hypothetical protein [Streptosporangium becharense]MBB5820319.1 hypothetical protein [Streptosporangium becharense]
MVSDFQPYTLHLQGVTVEAYILDKITLPFAPPYIETSTQPESFEMWWKWLTYVFDLSDPAGAPVLTLPLSKDDQSLIDRYLRSVDDLLESSLLNVGQSFAYNVTAEGVKEILEKEFLSREVSRGVTVTFRQLHSTKEVACFSRVYNVLYKRLDGQPPRVREEGQRMVAQWREAHNKLQGHSLLQLVRKKMIAQGVMGGQYRPFGYELPPEQLISLYQYGDLIHWGKKRDELAEVADDPILEGLYRITFMEVMLVFAHIYMGFAKVIEAMTRPRS